MPADRPHVTALHKGSLLQRSSQVEIIVLRIAASSVGEQVSQLFFIEASHGEVVAHLLQFRHLNGEKLLVPACVHCHAVVGKDVGFLLCIGQVVNVDTRHFRDAFLLRRHQATVTCDDIVFPVDDDRIDEAELTQRGTELLDLLRRVGAGVVYIRDELVGADKLKVSRCFHVYLTSCCGVAVPSGRPAESRQTSSYSSISRCRRSRTRGRSPASGRTD